MKAPPQRGPPQPRDAELAQGSAGSSPAGPAQARGGGGAGSAPRPTKEYPAPHRDYGGRRPGPHRRPGPPPLDRQRPEATGRPRPSPPSARARLPVTLVTVARPGRRRHFRRYGPLLLMHPNGWKRARARGRPRMRRAAPAAGRRRGRRAGVGEARPPRRDGTGRDGLGCPGGGWTLALSSLVSLSSQPAAA